VFIHGDMRFTCIDGPEFDGHAVNFEELMNRLSMFGGEEKRAVECLGGESGCRRGIDR